MRSIVQPGPPVRERIQWVEGRGRAFSFTLDAGLPLLEAARRGFAAEGFAGGTLSMKDGALGPFGYVMPALSKTGENAAFYSDIFRPAGIARLKMATMTLGARDGAPFFHCHGLWSEAELAAFLAPKVSRYKMPKRFFFWDALPKSGYGKVPKRLVRDELEARGLLDVTAKPTS